MNNYPLAYIHYLVHFHGDRDWFECHEILEEHWKANPSDPRNRSWIGLIQLAVGLYHERRGNRIGALKMLSSSITNLQADDLSELGLDEDLTFKLIEERVNLVREASHSMNFIDFNLPIMDRLLLDQCQELCNRLHLTWQSASALEDPMLIHKHMLRDRSDVIETRQQQIRLRQLQRGAEY